jgi:hypothetical protein
MIEARCKRFQSFSRMLRHGHLQWRPIYSMSLSKLELIRQGTPTRQIKNCGALAEAGMRRFVFWHSPVSPLGYRIS